MKKKLLKREIELQAYIDYINSKILFWIENGIVSSDSKEKDLDFYNKELVSLTIRLDEIRIVRNKTN